MQREGENVKALRVFPRTIVSGLCRWVMPNSSHVPLEIIPTTGRRIWLKGENEQQPSSCSLEDIERIFNIRYTPALLFENLWTKLKIEEYCRAMDKKHQISQASRWKGSYYSRELHRGGVAPVYIAWAGEIKGWGLFAREPIAKDAFIGEYAGMVQLVSFFFGNLTPYCFHYPLPMRSWLWFTINPQRYGNETRFMNHSEESNCSSHVMFHNGVFRVAICAERNIEKDEELTFNYGKTLWGEIRRFDEPGE